jgi:hypothetical protein
VERLEEQADDGRLSGDRDPGETSEVPMTFGATVREPKSRIDCAETPARFSSLGASGPQITSVPGAASPASGLP